MITLVPVGPELEERPPGLVVRSGFRILIVDDDDDIRLVFAEVLRELGYAVETATDGPSAIASPEGSTPTLLCLMWTCQAWMDLNWPST